MSAQVSPTRLRHPAAPPAAPAPPPVQYAQPGQYAQPVQYAQPGQYPVEYVGVPSIQPPPVPAGRYQQMPMATPVAVSERVRACVVDVCLSVCMHAISELWACGRCLMWALLDVGVAGCVRCLMCVLLDVGVA